MTPAGARQLAALNAPEPATTRLAPAEVRPHTPAEVCEALERAWLDKFGAEPAARSLAILMGQWAIETAHGRASWCDNLPNIRPPRPTGDVLCCQIPGGHVSEVIEGHEYFFAPPSVGSTFRAFEDLAAGARFYLDFLFGHFARAWPAVLAGDPDRYIDELHKPPAFFTADVNVYRKTFDSCFAHYLPLCETGVAQGPQPQVPEELTLAIRQARAQEQLDRFVTELYDEMRDDPSNWGAANIPKELDTADTDPSQLAPESQEPTT